MPTRAPTALSHEAISLRARLVPIFVGRRSRLCGKIACMPEAGVSVRETRDGRVANYHGVMTCNSVHACPVCSGKIRIEKRAKIERAMKIGARVARMFNGATFRMLTVTLRHDGSESLLSLRKGVLGAWRRLRKNGTIQRLWKKRVFGSVRAIEVTHGANGWHPHLHIVLLTTEWTAAELATLERAWCDAVLDELGEQAEPERTIGLRWTEQRPNSAYYLSKLGLEMTHVAAKRARGITSRNQWDIARDAVNGDARSVALWKEYETAMKGVRCIEMDERMADMSRYAKHMIECDCCGELNECHEKRCFACDEELPDAAQCEDDSGEAIRVALTKKEFAFIRSCEWIDPLATRRVLDAAARAGPLHADAIAGNVYAYFMSMLAAVRARDAALGRVESDDDDGRTMQGLWRARELEAAERSAMAAV